MDIIGRRFIHLNITTRNLNGQVLDNIRSYCMCITGLPCTIFGLPCTIFTSSHSLPVQTREAVPRETDPVRNSSEKVPNTGTNQGVDVSNASVPLFARATLVGSFRVAESAPTHRPSPPFASQPSPGAMVTRTARGETSQADEPPKFAKTAPLKDAKRGEVYFFNQVLFRSQSSYCGHECIQAVRIFPSPSI